MEGEVDRILRQHRPVLAELARDVFENAERAHHLAVLKAQDAALAISEFAVHSHFAMSHSVYRLMNLYCVENEEVRRVVEIDQFLRRYSELSGVFSGNWLATAGPDAMGNRFENLEATYISLQARLDAACQ